jgi:hypothetical protein
MWFRNAFITSQHDMPLHLMARDSAHAFIITTSGGLPP